MYEKHVAHNLKNEINNYHRRWKMNNAVESPFEQDTSQGAINNTSVTKHTHAVWENK